jgi:hypothetical protein
MSREQSVSARQYFAINPSFSNLASKDLAPDACFPDSPMLVRISPALAFLATWLSARLKPDRENT